jgi:hypothetical protein
MGDRKTPKRYSRRRFLKSGGALLAGGLVGGGATNALSQAKQTTDAPPALPWPWGKIDPMEAGSRAYHIYLDAGG